MPPFHEVVPLVWRECAPTTVHSAMLGFGKQAESPSIR